MTLTDRAQLWRFGAVALLIGLPLLLVALAIGNLAEASAGRVIAAKQDATAAQIVKEVAKRQAHRLQPQDTSSLFLAAASPSLARAELQERAGRFVEAAGGHLEEAQFTGTPEQEADGTVAIQLSLTIANAGLRDLLYAIETATPLLDATDLNAKPSNAQNGIGIGQAALLHVRPDNPGAFPEGHRMIASRLLPITALLLMAPIVTTSPALGQEAAARSLNPLASLDKATLKGFVDQPLFEPSRHPPIVVPPIAFVAPPPLPPMVEPPPSLRLLGLVEGAHSLAAVVHRNDTGRTETLRPGDRIGTWVIAVMPATLRVLSGDRAFDYALFRGGAEQGPMPVSPPPPFEAPTVAARITSPEGPR